MPGRSRYYKRKLYFSTADRILLHLLDYVGREGEFNQPDEVTQFGIAEMIGLGRSTVSKAIRRLEREKLVRSQRAHVPSGKLRRTVYLLTDTGVAKANRRRLEVEEEVVLFRDGTGVERRLRVGDLPRLVPEYATLLDVISHVSEGVFDAASFQGRRRQKFVDLTDRVPRLRYFFGRESELAAMDAWLASPTERVLVISGITGIGKTTLLSRKIEDWRGNRHVLFCRIMDWTTLRNVTQQCAEFLTRLGKKELSQYLEAKEAVDIEECVSILASNLADTPSLLVFDDFHNAEAPIQKLFYSLRAATETADGVKLVVAGRSVRPFYDRRDVKVKGTVREMALGGLDRKSSEQILAARNLILEKSEVQELYAKTRGHPLFLELVDSASVSTAEDVHKYLEEELLSRLTETEARVLTAASVFRYPVHADALFVDEGIDAATVRGLVEQSLLREVSARVYEIHDVLRTFFVDMMTPQERRRYHKWAAHFLVSQPDADPLESLYHLIEAEEPTSAARLAVKSGRQILRGGHSEELLRLLEKLIPAVEDPAHAAEIRLLKAHTLNVRGEIDLAVALYGEILRLPEDPALQPKIAEAHRSLGDVLRREGELDQAEQHLETALRMYRGLEHGEGQAETLVTMGTVAEDRGDLVRAERHYERAIGLAHALGMRAVEAEAQFDFSRILALRGELEAALDRKRRALAIAEGLADWHLQARFRVAMGTNLYALGRYDESVKAFEEGIEVARRIGDLRMLAYGLFNAAATHIRQNDLMRAESQIKEAETLFLKLREPVMEGLIKSYQAVIWEKRGRWHLAKQHFLAALDLLRSRHEPDFAKTASTAAFYFQKNGESASALALLQEALSVAKRLRMKGLTEELQRSLEDSSQVPARERGAPGASEAAPSS